MATIETFEDLEIWKAARKLSKLIYEITHCTLFPKDYRFINQINDASGSIMDNIAEGFERGNRKEFINFLGYAKGSAGEVRSQLHRALDNNYLTEEMFNKLFHEVTSISKKNQLTDQLFKFDRYQRSKVEI